VAVEKEGRGGKGWRAPLSRSRKDADAHAKKKKRRGGATRHRRRKRREERALLFFSLEEGNNLYATEKGVRLGSKEEKKEEGKKEALFYLQLRSTTPTSRDREREEKRGIDLQE